MAIKIEDLMSLAEEQSLTDGEAWRRSAISRAYYASYHRCLDWSRLHQRPRPQRRKGGVHQQLLNQLEKPSGTCSEEVVRRCAKLHRLLSNQRERRVAADYELDKDIARSLLKLQLRDAHAVFRECGG